MIILYRSRWVHAIIAPTGSRDYGETPPLQTKESLQFRRRSERLADYIGGLGSNRKASPLIIVLHEPTDCNERYDHLHVLYHHYRHSRVTGALEQFVAKYGLTRKFRDVWTPDGLRKYLHSGDGRCVLYEKTGDWPTTWEFGRDDNGETSSETRRRVREEGLRSEASSSSPESTDEGDSSDSEASVGGPPRKRKAAAAPKKKTRIEVLSELVAKYRPETSLELNLAILQHGTQWEKRFMLTANSTTVFGYQMDHVINLHHLTYKFTPWKELMRDLPMNILASKRGGYPTVEESAQWIGAILDHNGIDISDFVTTVADIMDRKVPKRNALVLKGPPNGGKSLILNSIADSALYAFRGDQPDPREARFTYAGMANARMALLNEFKIYSNVADKMLLLLEGADVLNDVKGKTGVTIPRTPMFISTNGDLCDGLTAREAYTKAPAVAARTVTYNFASFGDLKDCKYQYFNPLVWDYLLDKHLLTVETVELNEGGEPTGELWNMEYDANGDFVGAYPFVDDLKCYEDMPTINDERRWTNSELGNLGRCRRPELHYAVGSTRRTSRKQCLCAPRSGLL